MSVNFLIHRAKEIQAVIDANASEIEKLDQEIGDGDHIFNVQRGIKLVIELEAVRVVQQIRREKRKPINPIAKFFRTR